MTGPKRQCGNLFDVPQPPACHELYRDVTTQPACVYAALKACALRRWQWREDVAQQARVIYQAEHPGKRPELETLGRCLRGREDGGSEVGAKLAEWQRKGHENWLVLAHEGRVCLALDREAGEMMAKLGGGKDE